MGRCPSRKLRLLAGWPGAFAPLRYAERYTPNPRKLFEKSLTKNFNRNARMRIPGVFGAGVFLITFGVWYAVVGDGVLDVPHYWLRKPYNGTLRTPSPT